MDLTNLKDKLVFLRNHVDITIVADKNRVKEQGIKIKHTADDIIELGKVSEAVRLLQEIISLKTVDYLDHFLTEGLKVVFPNKLIEPHIKIGDRGSHKTAELWCREEIDGYPVERQLKSNFGGGIKVIVSVLLQALVIIDRGNERLLVLDENFTQISKEYYESLFDLLHLLIEKFGFKVLLVTQLDDFAKRSDKIYYVRNGKIKFVKDHKSSEIEREKYQDMQF